MTKYLTFIFLLCLIFIYSRANQLSHDKLSTSDENCISELMTTGVVDSCDGIAIADILDTLIACGGQEIGLMGAIGGGASLGTWVGGLGQFPDGINNLTGSYFPDPAEYGTSFPLLLITDDPPGICVSDTDTVIITVLMPPVLEPILPVTACGGSFDLLNLSVVDSNNSVGQLYFYDSLPLTTPLASTVITSSGIYYVLKITNTTPSCFDTVSVDVTINPPLLLETWTGAIDNNWNNEGNWTCNVPDSTQVVIIPTGTISCIVYSGQSGICNTIVIESGAELIVQPTGRLEIDF